RDGLDRLGGFSCPGVEAAQGAGLQGIDSFDGLDGFERPGLDQRALQVPPAAGRVPRGWVGESGVAVVPVLPIVVTIVVASGSAFAAFAAVAAPAATTVLASAFAAVGASA